VQPALGTAWAIKLPLLEWCEVPAGTVTVEGKVYRVAPFLMSKYPVTDAQFQPFIEALDGFYSDACWSGLPPEVRPTEPGVQRWPLPDHPREHVSWYDALAFCRWLSRRTGLPIRLPTEQEWQRAAQGDDGRVFPWGNYYDDTSRCNTRETGLARTTPVGQFPKGVGAYGVHDLAGNVWEWCLNEYENPSRIAVGGTKARVLRGGSWFSIHDAAQNTVRYFALPHTRDFDVGFRLVCSAVQYRGVVRPALALTLISTAKSTLRTLRRGVSELSKRM